MSSLVAHGGRVLAFYGEGDAHLGVATFDAAELAAELARHPFVPADPVTVRLAPPSMGYLFDAMSELAPREMRRAWMTAFGNAKLDARHAIEPDDLPHASHRRTPIGFMQ